jgi:hypothetical protein
VKLSDVVSHAGLSFYAEVALVIFAVVFVVVGFRLLRKGRGAYDAAAALPLVDDVAAPRAEKLS